ncbi:MAG: ribosome biogenesis factor YjgA [Cycloclasticus sp.]
MIEDDEYDDDFISKTQIKREADDLVGLGKTIADLSAEQFDGMPLSDNLRESIRLVRKLSKGGAIKRQYKYIGKLLRETDVDEIRQAIERLLDKDRAASARLHLLEKWRDRLAQEGDSALSEFVEQYPTADRQHLRQLQRKAKQELERDKPPAAARKIFQYIKDISKQTG